MSAFVRGQRDIFDIPKPRARHTDPDTSHEAAESVEDSAPAQRAQILEYLRNYGPLTADALDEALGLRLTSAGRRLPELQGLRLVDMTRSKAKTRTGRFARLWKAT